LKSLIKIKGRNITTSSVRLWQYFEKSNGFLSLTINSMYIRTIKKTGPPVETRRPFTIA